jgi:hypothetical protein
LKNLNPSHRIGAAGMVAAIMSSLAIAFGPALASAKTTTTLRLFAKSVAFGMFHANGKPITNPNVPPKPGDYLIGTDIDYVGNHKKHAKIPTGGDNAVCTFTTATKAVCDEVIAIGGSLLLADHVTVDFRLTSPVSRITGGTGKFKRARGTITVTPLLPTSNSDFTVRYSTGR